MPNASPSRAGAQRWPARTRRVVLMGAGLFVLLIVLFYPQAFRLHLAHSNLQSAWLLFVVSATSFLGVLILGAILLRQILKLLAERRARLLGSKFKTKLVIGALGLSLIPVLCMFLFTWGFINRTLEKWFSRPVEMVRDDTEAMGRLLTGYIRDNATSEALSIAQDRVLIAGLRQHQTSWVQAALRRHRVSLQGGFVLVINAQGQILARFRTAGAGGALAPPARLSDPVTRGEEQYILAQRAVPHLRPAVYVQVGMPIPMGLADQMQQLKADYANYARLAWERSSLHLVYTGFLLLLTLLILFAATWFALFLSKLVTVPIQALVSATQEISRGNLAHRIAVSAGDEIGELVESFNGMAAELDANRQQIEASRRQLQHANSELEQRRRYTETLLENIPSAVISLNAAQEIERANAALTRLLGTEAGRARQLEELFDPESAREVHHLLRRAERLGAASSQIELAAGDGRSRTAAITAAALGWPAGDASGYVLVLDDLSEVLRMQRVAAWREVARRIAHEIKNPLTPIALSAQRMRRWLQREPPTATVGEVAPPTAAVVAECADTISREVDSLKRLVNEFSSFARFPAAQPRSCCLNEIIEDAVRAFSGRLDGIQLTREYAELPPLNLDPEEMKRVFINLIDNAAEAVAGRPLRHITLSTSRNGNSVEAVVADTGAGVPTSAKERLFLPYFSTKERGTGLGLAIVNRIVEEHGGSVRVEDNLPVGTRILVELPLPEASVKS